MPLTDLSAEEFEVKAHDIKDQKAVFATVESVDRILARARIGGTIGALTIDEGAEVTAGQKIAVISDKKLPLKLTSLNAKLSSLVAQRKLAETDLKRIKSLRRTGAASQSRLDVSETKLDIVKSEIASLNAERSIVNQQIKDGGVLAPASGRVLSVAITNGSVILPGETIAVIAKDSYILRLRLPERHARFLEVGDKVQVGQRGKLSTNKLADARVQQVYPEMEQGRVIADVKVTGLGSYFVGERTRVHIATGSRTIISAPERFFFKRYGITFAKLKSGGEVILRLGLPVKEGAVEVLSGLKAGDILVTP
ncbi:MAG: HlyD family efflux transporter periplasmic adaptor subunit [Rhodospirillaceae bacterium]|nr:HlyD family efflux transporter periplasmic adaptor subunit [Rhodospirillaceae bacterium]MBT4939994.1 HlyD family efflux transporter periplasmic adaptor subunit [Rhodospirillaceae bacterium]MBT5940258.1 HlyD family efflux transporter periplasmic adaptor subunit [Rhodospirillaceae bacterium]MBT7267164.1 HlyD family efflux transporter periplasmic adaptor subunit [Rhodospirillaceae bacterium]